MVLHKERFTVPDLVRSTLTILNERAEHEGVTLELVIPENMPPLNADRRKVKQVLLNYLSNALKFTPSGGTVTTHVTDNPHEVRIEVQDTGIGIPEEDQAKLFKPFSQIDTSLTRKHLGTGLGLTLAKRFVELHGGQVWVQSEPGQGSTFGFSIPRNLE